VVLYQLLTDKLPFEGANAAEIMHKILLQPPLRLWHQGKAHPPELQQIVDRALAKRKEERFQSCSEMAEALAQLRDNLKTVPQLAGETRDGVSPPALPDIQENASVRDTAPRQAALAAATSAKIAPSQLPISPPLPEIARTPPLQQCRDTDGQAPKVPTSEKSKSLERGGHRMIWSLASLAIVVAAASFYYWQTGSSTSTAPLPPAIDKTSAFIPPGNVQLSLIPVTAQVVSGNSVDLMAVVSGTNETALIWSVKEGNVGGSVIVRSTQLTERGMSFRAVYVAPKKPGTYHIMVGTKFEPRASAMAEVTVTPHINVPVTTPANQSPPSESPFTVR